MGAVVVGRPAAPRVLSLRGGDDVAADLTGQCSGAVAVIRTGAVVRLGSSAAGEGAPAGVGAVVVGRPAAPRVLGLCGGDDITADLTGHSRGAVAVIRTGAVVRLGSGAAGDGAPAGVGAVVVGRPAAPRVLGLCGGDDITADLTGHSRGAVAVIRTGAVVRLGSGAAGDGAPAGVGAVVVGRPVTPCVTRRIAVYEGVLVRRVLGAQAAAGAGLVVHRTLCAGGGGFQILLPGGLRRKAVSLKIRADGHVARGHIKCAACEGDGRITAPVFEVVSVVGCSGQGDLRTGHSRYAGG